MHKCRKSTLNADALQIRIRHQSLSSLRDPTRYPTGAARQGTVVVGLSERRIGWVSFPQTMYPCRYTVAGANSSIVLRKRCTRQLTRLHVFSRYKGLRRRCSGAANWTQSFGIHGHGSDAVGTWIGQSRGGMSTGLAVLCAVQTETA